MPSWPTRPGEGLDGDVADAEEDSGGGGEHDAVVLGGGAGARAQDEQAAHAEQGALEADHRGQREGRVRAVRVGHRDAQQDEADGGEGQAPPLPPADLEAEEAIGHHGDEHDAAGEDDLHDGQRHQRDGGHVEGPGPAADDHADREPARGVQRLGRAQRMAHVDGRSLASTAVLEEEAQVGSDGAEKRQQDAELKSHAGFIGPVRSTWRYRPMTLSSAPPESFLTDRRGRQASERLRDHAQQPETPALRGHRRRALAFRLSVRQASSRGVDKRRGHRSSDFGQRFRAPAPTGRPLRPGLVQRMGGEGQRAPSPCASPAHCAAVPHLHRARWRNRRHWKLDAIDAHAGDRPLAWIDDAHDDSCRAWASSRAAPTLLVTTDPASGLTGAHVEALEHWAGGLAPAANHPHP